MTTPVWFHLLRTPLSFTNHELSFHHAVPVRSPYQSPRHMLMIRPLAIPTVFLPVIRSRQRGPLL
jgi:hypothetical protein